jgi:integrase
MSNIELRGNTWFATLHVPKDVREVLGRSKLIRTLKTADRRLAQERAMAVVAEWKALIRNARGNAQGDTSGATTDSFTMDALKWRESVITAKDQQEQEAMELLMTDRAEELEQSKGYPAAKAFADIVLGVSTPISPLIEPWAASLANHAEKTRSLYIPVVKKMAAKFKTLEAIDRKAVRAWILELQGALSGATIQRNLGACQNMWEWCQARDLVDIDFTPFKGHQVKVKKQSYVPFTPAEVVHLWKLAAKKDNQPLADLIQLGAYTGGRIEELCQTKVEHVTDHGSILVPGTKTDAAIREVPVHRSIKKLVERLVKDSKDGYLIPSPANNARGNRSDPLSKTFGRLKGELGYEGDRTRVFHSIRKTLVTLLENAGVPEGVTADIVGHEKQTMTYGLYSGGNSLEVKREALEKISYKGM